MNKEKVIASIKQRILDEHRKHKDLDWAEIAARKIYSTHIVKNCSIPIVSVMSEHHCGNKLTEKELFHDLCLKCGEYISED